MKSTVLVVTFLLLLGTALTLPLGAPARASNQIAEKTGLACTVCHDKPGSRRLTDKGLYYEQTRTLDGYDRLKDFAECTSCHVRKPGSQKLTRTGRRFARVVHDMEGLRLYLQDNHPPMESH